ncbi:hypothetical protein FOXYSP1_20512 [Fusarium oxysporum f. sp. phaseoli]
MQRARCSHLPPLPSGYQARYRSGRASLPQPPQDSREATAGGHRIRRLFLPVRLAATGASRPDRQGHRAAGRWGTTDPRAGDIRRFQLQELPEQQEQQEQQK